MSRSGQRSTNQQPLEATPQEASHTCPTNHRIDRWPYAPLTAAALSQSSVSLAPRVSDGGSLTSCAFRCLQVC